MPLEDDLPNLRRDLGEAGYRWLCACAVAPVLRWELTIHLGRTLAAAEGRDAPNEADFLALAHLSWFRKGRIPDRIRRQLIADLPPATLRLVRRTLRESFSAAGEAPTSWGEWVRALLRDARRGFSLSARLHPPAPSDPVFIDTMLGLTADQAGQVQRTPITRRFGLALNGLSPPQVAAPMLASTLAVIAIFLMTGGEPAPTVSVMPEPDKIVVDLSGRILTTNARWNFRRYNQPIPCLSETPGNDLIISRTSESQGAERVKRGCLERWHEQPNGFCDGLGEHCDLVIIESGCYINEAWHKWYKAMTALQETGYSEAEVCAPADGKSKDRNTQSPQNPSQTKK